MRNCGDSALPGPVSTASTMTATAWSPLALSSTTTCTSPAGPGTGFFAAGALLLAGARITGQFDMRGATLAGERPTQDGVSLFADSLQVGRGLMMSTRGDLRFAAGGTLRLTAARITGQVDLTGAELHGNERRGQPALHADGMYVDGDVALDHDGRYPFTALGAVRLLGAQITDSSASAAPSCSPGTSAWTQTRYGPTAACSSSPRRRQGRRPRPGPCDCPAPASDTFRCRPRPTCCPEWGRWWGGSWATCTA